MTKEENDGVFPFIEGERIDLITVNPKWADLSCKWTNDPEIRHYSRNAWPTTLEEVKKWFEPSSDQGIKDFIVFNIYHKKDKKPIGIVGFNRINWLNRNANTFWTIGEKEYWGRGLAVEASKILITYGFTELNLHKLYAGIFTPNKRSLRVAEKMGFKKEAVLKEDLYVDGTYVDTHIFSIMKNDWMEENK
ncbi:MAG: GNAT family N-acetyltransferase [Candidatus Thorarchaeota archaeon]